MNDQQIKSAFSQVHASDRLTKEVIAMKNERKTVPVMGKLARAALVAAIVMALLTTTVFAAATITNALRGGSINSDGTILFGPQDGDGRTWNLYQVNIDVELNADAPQSIERYYLPSLDGEHVQYFGFVYRDQMASCFAWTNGEGNWEDEIRFVQLAGGSFDAEQDIFSVYAEPGIAPEEKLAELAGVQGYLVEDASGYGSRHFIWSDGDYVYQLMVPNEYTDEQIAGVLTSITEIEDILPYCISMTEEDRETVFG